MTKKIKTAVSTMKKMSKDRSYFKQSGHEGLLEEVTSEVGRVRRTCHLNFWGGGSRQRGQTVQRLSN